MKQVVFLLLIVSLKRLLENQLIQGQIGYRPFQTAVLSLQVLESPYLGCLHHSVFFTPVLYVCSVIPIPTDLAHLPTLRKLSRENRPAAVFEYYYHTFAKTVCSDVGITGHYLYYTASGALGSCM